MKLLPKIGILAAGIIMSVSFAAGIKGNDAIEVSAATGNLVATFELGANGDAEHKDNNSAKTEYSEKDGDYTLNITGGDKMYPSSYDAAGNSCIKFGSSSAVGKMSFTVPADITSVILAVGKYKDKDSNINVNGTDYTLTKNSNDGAYDAITVDTSSKKTVSFTTVSGACRAMLNTIEYYSDPATAKELDSISAELKSSEKTWYVGDIVTADDIVVTAHYTSGDPEVITSGYTLSNNELSLGLNTITVEYEDEKCTLEVTAIEKPVLKSATITGTAKAAVGGVWDLSDLVVNGTSTTDVDMGDITDKCELSTDASTEDAGNYTITVSVTYEGVTVDVHNVSAKVLNTVEKTDTLTRATTGVPEGTNYGTWEYTSEDTDAKYSGNSAGEHNSIQIRSKNYSGIITLVSGGLVKSISIKFNSNTLESRELDIFGSNNPYINTANLYGTDDLKGNLVHTFAYSSTEQTYDFEADYSYIGIRSKSGALYIDQISITWASYVEDSEEPTASELVGDFVDTYMHMEDYATNQGLCAGEDGYYAIAKKAFHDMKTSYTGTEDLVEVFQTEHADAYSRYLNWAVANGDTSPFVGDSINPISINILGLSKDNSDNILVIIFSILGCLSFGLIALIMRKRFIRK